MTSSRSWSSGPRPTAFYRSRHELIFVFKKGTSAHINTFGLGETGRYRTNVWEHPGINTFRSDRDELATRPTIKLVALVADAIRTYPGAAISCWTPSAGPARP